MRGRGGGKEARREDKKARRQMKEVTGWGRGHFCPTFGLSSVARQRSSRLAQVRDIWVAIPKRTQNVVVRPKQKTELEICA